MDEIISDINIVQTPKSFIRPDLLPTELGKSLAEMGRVIEDDSSTIPPTEINTDQAVDIFSRDNYRLLHDKFSEYGSHIMNMSHHLRDFKHPKLNALYGISFNYSRIILNKTCEIEYLTKLITMSKEDAKIELMEYKTDSYVSEKTISYTDYEGFPCTISNHNRDRVYRYRRTHVDFCVSNAELAQQIEYDLGIPKGTAENCLSDIRTFFLTPGEHKWLSPQYIHEVDHYLKSTFWGKNNVLNFKYADNVPNQSQIYQYGIELNIISSK